MKVSDRVQDFVLLFPSRPDNYERLTPVDAGQDSHYSSREAFISGPDKSENISTTDRCMSGTGSSM